MRLSNGSNLERMEAPPGMLAAERTGREVRIMARGTQIVLQLKKRELLRDSIALAGAALPDAPLAVLLLLALTAHFDEAPDPIVVQRGAAVAQSIRRAGAVLALQRVWSAAEIRQAAAEALESGQLGFELPDGAWNVARTLVEIGALAWRLEGAAAAWWGSIPSAFVTANDEAQMEQRMLLSHIAALVATPPLLGALPLHAASDTDPAEIWIDWMGLAAGPGTPPRELRPAGLGARGDSPLEAHDETSEDDLTLTLAQGEALDATGRGLLASLDRPVPRLLGRLLDVAISGDLLPQIAAWAVATIRVQVVTTGLWIAALDSEGRSLAAAWWRAEAASAERAPISFPPAAWALIHPVLAGLWHDLCADVVQVAPEAREDISEATEAATERPPTRSSRGDHAPRRRSVALPGTQRATRQAARATWADAADRAALAQARSMGNDYRRLPAGWQDRVGQRDFRRRQEEAAARAVAARRAAPPPGFTFVREFVRGAGTPAPASEVPVVRSRGLFAVLLAIQGISEE